MYLEKEEMKFAVVYTIKQYKAPLNMSKVYEILTWERAVMQYLELSEVLMELLEDGYIYKKFYRNEESYCLTERGEDAYTYFKSRIPFSVRANIDEIIGRIKYDEISDPNAIRAEVVPINENQYGVRYSITDEKQIMLEMTLNIGGRAQAENAAGYFRDNAGSIYQGILSLCIPDLKKKDMTIKEEDENV